MTLNYRDCIDDSLQFIRANLERPLTLDEVAQASHFSSFHFHRIFHAVTGETVHDCISRLRLERTVHLLRFQPELSIIAIAHTSGYSSSANFSKAFKAYFGVTPSQIRKPGSSKDSKIGKLENKYGKAFRPAALYPSPMKKNIHIEVRNVPGQITSSLSSEEGYEGASIFATWDKLIEWAEMNQIPAGQQRRFALCYDNPLVTPLNKCRYEAMMVIDSETIVRPPFKKSAIPAGEYAVMAYEGASEGSSEAIMALYSEWLPSSGFEPDHFPMMEHYLNDVRQDGFVKMEIFIKLRPLKETV